MGNRDVRHREKKKLKKDKKTLTSSVIPPEPISTEVVKKVRKEPEPEE